MAQGTVYVPPTPAELNAIAGSHMVDEDLTETAEAGRAYAESIAPRATGEYAASFEVVTEGDEVQLVNTSDHAAYVEWVDGYHVLAQATDRIEGGP